MLSKRKTNAKKLPRVTDDFIYKSFYKQSVIVRSRSSDSSGLCVGDFNGLFFVIGRRVELLSVGRRGIIGFGKRGRGILGRYELLFYELCWLVIRLGVFSG